jgi:phosphoglycolate phosphatase
MSATESLAARFDAAIVDLDGTMVDTVGDFVVALDLMLAEFALPAVDRTFVLHTIGKGSENLIRQTLHSVGGDAALYERAFERYQHHYGRINGDHSAVFPGVLEGLQRLQSAGLRLGCVSNKPTVYVRELLRIKELDGFFVCAFGGDAFERKKPDPMPLVKSCEALGTAPARTVMIGDSSNDVVAARGAGCPVVLVNYGYNHGEPVEAAGADRILDRIDQL